MGILITIILGFLYAEFVGYWLHRLLHNERIPALSRAHMIHHLRDYGPRMPQRSPDYKVQQERAVAFGLGFEWVVPIVLILGGTAGLLAALSVPFWSIVLFLGSGIAWGFGMFSYMHDVLHVEGTWFLSSPLRKWFVGVRRLHDIHHIHLNDEGKMPVNYGICFFFMDKIFGTYKTRIEKFNEVGYSASKSTYGYIYDASGRKGSI